MLKYLEVIGAESLIKGFLVFLLYGISITTYINVAHGLDSELPETVIMTLEGPLSIYTFGWLTFVGLLLLSALSKCGRVECNIENKKPFRIFWVALPFCEAAIALGVVIGATLLGIALSAHFISMWNEAADKIYPMFYALSVFFVFVTYPVVYFTILTVSTEKKVERQLNWTVAAYVVLVGLILFIGLPVRDIVEIGVSFGALMLVFLLWKYFLRNHNK